MINENDGRVNARARALSYSLSYLHYVLFVGMHAEISDERKHASSRGIARVCVYVHVHVCLLTSS